jgi:hypothetical protein
MKIFNTQVYGLDESFIRSGYPMQTEIEEIKYDRTLWMAPHMMRAVKLASCKTGSGHDNFLKGIVVQMDVEAPQYVWMQIERYQFFTIISSQSKMHRLMQMETGTIPNVCNEAANILEAYKGHSVCGECDMDELMANVPMGLELTAGISTNYMCLKNMYHQRKNHRLKFWTECFCPWVEGLPMAKELIIGEIPNQ